MKLLLERLYDHEKLERAEAKQVLIDISQSIYAPAQVASFITVFLMRAISLHELLGFRDALQELCVPVNLHGMTSIDVCGTGGDGKNTFNISTLSAFVVAGAGYRVTKHGNYGVSSSCGSSNVLEALGVRFSSNSDVLLKQLEKAGICFLHAPLFHPALRSVGGIRKELGVKTFFNMLGPLVNPARPTHQMVGVFSLQLLRLYQYLYEGENTKYAIVHGLSGFDEISLSDDTKIISQSGGEEIINAQSFGLSTLSLSAIAGGEGVEDAKRIFLNVLTNDCTTAQRQVVLANSAIAIRCFEPQKPIVECYEVAQASLESGRAYQTLTSLLDLQ